MTDARTGRPRIAITVQAERPELEREAVRARNEPYADAVRDAGGDPILIDEFASDAERSSVLFESFVAAARVDRAAGAVGARH